MFKNILNQNQVSLLPLIKSFSKEFYLVGGTAIALQIGHRESIDFDLFSATPIHRDRIKKVLSTNEYPFQVIFEDTDQLHGVINNVRLTFYEYPYPIQPEIQFEDIITLPSLLTLAAMKAFALGKRAKWKDYVDMYFLLKGHFTLEQISAHASTIFGSMYNPKLLRQQLTYYEDVNYSEIVEYVGSPVQNAEIERFLTSVATEVI